MGLPILEFVLWMVDGLLLHSYYEKAMKNQHTIMQRTAMSEHQKMSILIIELVRRLNNIHREVMQDELEPVIEHYITQLKNSGYNRKQTKEVIVCGVVGWKRKQERREKEGRTSTWKPWKPRTRGLVTSYWIKLLGTKITQRERQRMQIVSSSTTHLSSGEDMEQQHEQASRNPRRRPTPPRRPSLICSSPTPSTQNKLQD